MSKRKEQIVEDNRRKMPRAGVKLKACFVQENEPVRASFVRCEYDDYWSVILRHDKNRMYAVMRHTTDGWVSGVYDALSRVLVVSAVGDKFDGEAEVTQVQVGEDHRWAYTKPFPGTYGSQTT